jgi:hypothetical protein
MKKIRIFCVWSCVCLLPGCNKVVEWGKRSFNQGVDVLFNKSLIKEFIKGATLYDELDTAAKFDVLWLSDAVRSEYARLHAYTQGKSDEFYQGLLRRQLEENKHFVTFYILSLYDMYLGMPESKWQFFLRVGDKNIAPSEIKAIELLPEYKTFFGDQLTRFRAPYRVMFDAKDIDDNDIITSETKIIELVFRSTHKELVLGWNYKPHVIVPTTGDDVQKTESSEMSKEPVTPMKGELLSQEEQKSAE